LVVAYFLGATLYVLSAHTTHVRHVIRLTKRRNERRRFTTALYETEKDFTISRKENKFRLLAQSRFACRSECVVKARENLLLSVGTWKRKASATGPHFHDNDRRHGQPRGW